MTVTDLTKTLKKYKSGWVAIDESNKRVVAHAKDFSGINKKVANKKNVFIMAATEEYFGFVT
jgi:hypothetical protein